MSEKPDGFNVIEGCRAMDWRDVAGTLPTDRSVLIAGPTASGKSALAMEMCAFAEDVALTVHPHPTLGEGVMEAFKHALGEAVHVMNRR